MAAPDRPAYGQAQEIFWNASQGGGPGIPPGTPLADSHASAATANDCTLTGGATTTVYISGFWVGGLGATGATTIAVTVTGLAATLTFNLAIPAGAAVAVTPLYVLFPVALPASAVNTPIVVHVPSYGTGNLTASANAWGHQV